jgi:hypothetical protein
LVVLGRHTQQVLVASKRAREHWFSKVDAQLPQLFTSSLCDDVKASSLIGPMSEHST